MISHFRRNALARWRKLRLKAEPYLFVSHNMAAVSALCTKGILLLNGKIVCAGAVNEVINAYIKNDEKDITIPLAERVDRRGNGRLRFTKVSFCDESGRTNGIAVSGKPLKIVLEYEGADGDYARNVDALVEFYGTLGELLFACHVRVA